MKVRVGARQGLERESVKISYGLTHWLPPSPSFPECRKGGARRRERRKEEMTNRENYFPICGTWCALVFQRGGKVAFSWAHAEWLCGPRSKLSPCWKIPALHDRSTSLSTLLFTFLPQPGSNFTCNYKLANAIYHVQLEAPARSYWSPQSSPHHLHQWFFVWCLTVYIICFTYFNHLSQGNQKIDQLNN